MNYLGSKKTLLSFLDNSILEVVGNNKTYTFCDLFAGTGAVGKHFKKKGYKIIANDFLHYSYCLNKHYIGNNKELKFINLIKEIPELKEIDIVNRKEFVIVYLNELQGNHGYIYKNYSSGGTIDKKYFRLYFSDKNAKRCDVIRKIIETWHKNKLINEGEYFFLLASLIESIDNYANTTSRYGSYLKHLKKSAKKKLELEPAELIKSNIQQKVYCQDANTLIDKIDCDILYLDPPYNTRQYASNYHLLETIAKYDNPKINGITGLRDCQKQKSLYSSKIKALETFSHLIKNAKAKYIFLSYNNEGLLKPNEIKNVFSQKGKYGYFTKNHNRFKTDKKLSRIYKSSKTTEYLHYCICN
jgi:adenine-specific DNA-methyltransferase